MERLTTVEEGEGGGGRVGDATWKSVCWVQVLGFTGRGGAAELEEDRVQFGREGCSARARGGGSQ